MKLRAVLSGPDPREELPPPHPDRQQDDGTECRGGERTPETAKIGEPCWVETIAVEGGELLEEVRRLVHEGNVREPFLVQPLLERSPQWHEHCGAGGRVGHQILGQRA